MLSSGSWFVVVGLVPVGALAGALLFLDARGRRWSNLPWYAFVCTGVIVLVPVVLMVVKLLAGFFSGVRPG